MQRATNSSIFQRSGVDRRAGEEHRQVHHLAYFEQGCVERRKSDERRVSGENRAGWVRVTDWSSINALDVFAAVMAH